MQRKNRFVFYIVAPSVFTVLLFVVSFYLVIVPKIEENYIDQKTEMIEEIMNSVLSLLNGYYIETLENPEREAENKKQVLEKIRPVRYGSGHSGYFWVLDTTGMMLMHPHSRYLENIPVDVLEEPFVNDLLKKIASFAKMNNHGIIKYHWNDLQNPDVLVPKISYVKTFAQWGWILGTGLYLEDVETETSAIKTDLAGVSGLITLILAILAFIINRHSLNIEKERVETEKSLKESTENFKTLFETANDAMLILDTEFKIIDCNNKTLDLQGYSREEIIGNSPLKFSTPTQAGGRASEGLAVELITKSFQNQPQSLEWNLLNKDGSIKPTWISMSLFSAQNKKYVLVILRDMTTMKKMEQKLLLATIQTEENVRARFAKELHDGIGPIFSTVKLYFQWLAELDNQKDKKEVVEKGNKNIEEAIASLRDMSYNLSPHILNNFGLETAIRDFIKRNSKLHGTKIVLESNIEQRFLCETELTLYRIVTELINNSLKYASAESIHIGLYHDTGLETLNIHYTDDGVGFDVDKALASNKGMGLYNIQSRIKTLEGDVRFSSGIGKGLEVKIFMHLNKQYG
jgi:PAS domain S-box-containing protein